MTDTQTAGRLAETTRGSAVPYLVAVIMALFVGLLGEYLKQYVWEWIPTLFGQGPEVYASGALILVAAILWLLYDGHRTRQPWLVAFFALLLLTWLAHFVISKYHLDAFLYSVFLTPAVVLALWLKTPSSRDIMRALLVAAWTTAVILVTIRALELLGWIPMLDVGPEFLSYEKGNYWLPLANTLGPEGRWHGPFGHAARTGAAAAFVLVVAVAAKGGWRWPLGVVAVLALLLTASRGAQIAAVAGVLVVVVLGDNALTRRVRRAYLVAGLGAMALMSLAAVLMRNPNLTGRTTYWSVALDVWSPSPVLGIGTTGMQASDLAMAGTNAHNIVLDSLVKYGLIGTGLVVAVLGVAGVLALRGVRHGTALPIGIFATYLVLGATEADTEWLKWTLPWLWLVLATTLGGCADNDDPPAAHALGSGVDARGM